VVVGSINADLLVTVERHPKPGETLLATGASTAAGGKGANQALAAALRGARVAMVGAVGDNANAEAALSHLREADVDLAGVRTVPGPTGLALVTLSADGENSIVVVPGANASVTSECVRRAESVVSGAAVLVVQGEIPAEGVEAAVGVAADAGARVVINLAPVLELPSATLRCADPLVLNEFEADLLAELVGVAPASADGRLAVPAEAGHADDCAAALVAWGIPSLVITLGPVGAVGCTRDETFFQTATKVAARDTTGAGDAFVGAMSAELARGLDLRAAVAIATKVAAFSVQRSGAQPSYPTVDDPLP
jgi:ribokinase